MPNISIKEAVMNEIARRMGLIKKTSGYWTDVRVVQRTHDMLPERPTGPHVYVYEGMEQKDDGQNPNFIECSMPVGIVYVCDSYTDKATWSNRMLQDVETALGLEYSYTCPSGQVVRAYLRLKSTDVQVDDQGGPVVVAATILEAQYRHAPGDPTDVVC